MPARPLRISLAVLALLAATPWRADARTMVFAESWQNGTSAWRTQRANGGDCKGWPVCPFDAAEVVPSLFPEAMMVNAIQIRDHDGEGDRDKNICNGKYVHIPRMYAGYDAANIQVTGAVTVEGTSWKNSQFAVQTGDRLCMVAWLRAYDEGGSEAGPYVGINYAGVHGVVDAGHSHGTHYVIGSMADDPANMSWSYTPRVSYGPMTQVIKDGAWHRYTAAFTVDSNDTTGKRLFSPEFRTEVKWDTTDRTVYGQPRLILFGRPPERKDPPATVPPIENGADFGDLYVFRAEGDENACPSDAELAAIENKLVSDKIACGKGTSCVKAKAPIAETVATPAYPENVAYQCWGCKESFGAPASETTCTETTPFCTKEGARGGTCAACSGDAATEGEKATQCSAKTPTCITAGEKKGACGKCTNDDDCTNAPGAKIHPGPSCNKTTGACFSCSSDYEAGGPTACSEQAPYCDRTTGRCDRQRDSDKGGGGGSSGQLTSDDADAGMGGCATTHGQVSSSASVVGVMFAIGAIARRKRRR